MRVINTAKTGIFAGYIISITLGIVGCIVAPTTSALSLGSANLGLPLGTLGQPVANLLNPVTQSLPVPVSIQSTPSTLSAGVTTPILGTPVNVNATLPPVAGPIISPPPAANPSQPTTPTSPNSSGGSGTLTVQKSQPSQDLPVFGSRNAERSSQSSTLFDKVTSFFTSTMPDVLNNLASTVVGKPVNPVPVAVSIMIFLATLVSVGAIVYANNTGGTLTIGKLNLTKFARAHDVTQMAAFIVTAASLGVITMFLTLTSF